MNNFEDLKLDFKESLEKLNNNKTKDELEKTKLFKTINIATPQLWLDQWKLNKNNELLKKYKKIMAIPDPNNNNTIYQLLIMSRNAYVPPNSGDWVDLEEYGWKIQYPFGWNSDPNEKTSNRVRGYIFKNEEKKIIVISIKGTSAGLFGIGGPTAEYDRLNDNMMFSCCCAYVDASWSWSKVCNCHSGITNTCEMSCLKKEALNYENSYYNQLMDIYYKSDNIQQLRLEGYEVFFTGHSLGGALASLSGLSILAPVVTFEAPGEEQFAKRIGIVDRNIAKEKYKELPIFHFGNNGDPIYTGKCTGITSTCYHSGFAMETKCHVGRMYMFDLDKNHGKDPADDKPDDDKHDDDKPADDKPDNDKHDDDKHDNDKPENDYSNKDPNKNIKGKNNYTPISSSSFYRKSKESPIFLINKSSIDEHQFQLFSKRLYEKEEEKNLLTNNVESSLKTPTNPGKLNMLHHRVDYVINLLKKWEGPWPEESIQDSCIDCDNWEFQEGEGDEGRTDPIPPMNH
ncbi:hypothetical protein BCR36DRAFT_587794 [Piromyces finnis]|uniref:triacylglycerol lipase n=1 Tax=Piromyces finnis TaxID=1754191 RepID=A0A1Y1UVY1_9FUNG|nr:hypothetical protein BCR36DRAFT_587794 [Piromyces finnis]|eukprot:ORX41769.1 hypothetical protein BCR36DRAFT_587794 [Piromyces finnis]